MGLSLTGAQREAALAAVRAALAEDLAYGPDATTLATVDAAQSGTASVVAREPGVLAGVQAAVLVLDEVLGPDGYALRGGKSDGDRVLPGDAAFSVTAPLRGLLTAERTLLNLMCHLSGIATATARWADQLAGTKAKVRDTRKTLPGLRLLQKHAVVCGGGVNHRMGLGDAALIKDNHVAAAGSVAEALRRVRAFAPQLAVEVEVDTLAQLEEILAEGVELVLLDNFDVETTAKAVALRDERSPATLLESSGGLALANARAYAETGVDYLAVGALTHSARALDLGLDLGEAGSGGSGAIRA
ncbi:carboxylating nicotinate-nucleotide diphosphorylase [Segniliparus rugosus]|uniref:Nicotinate-nucleotide pyrophosphorylase [carboxylating] n=1 Tax=Segniliparus rugosus (strain ATCC BAA-974 / DSM 45345 / CCUG 50838 / CIP 108380 / JCM 13579 / CDC 945) TaxID=679197 RepID=E5XLL0_SEGRC|nr:carboxylating nicotinate-nucleotide diphosphorylase [Segniliparus rugosus]EFV14783.1 nicotinate-nucleotide diphosphorylase (carboxylating) [Segniliparus rugosus ATCC BAA-974]